MHALICQNVYVMHLSFVSMARSGPGNSGAFNFSIFKALLKAIHSVAKIVVKSLLKASALPGLTRMKKTTLCVKSDVRFLVLGDNFLLLEGMKSIFLSASRSQFVTIGPAKILKIGQQITFL